ncbi:MAG: PQQ-dependent sugar dehydrogenase, partial [Vicinamibacterales bacterium]
MDRLRKALPVILPAAVLFALAALPTTAFAQLVPTGFTDELVVEGLTAPTAFTRLPDGRILIAEKDGLVRVFKNGALLGTPFIDLRSRVNDYWDRGLIGIAADPAFSTTGHVYVLYVYENDAADYSGTKTSRLTRVTAAGDTAPLSSEVVILGAQVGSSCSNFPVGADCIPADAPSHSVGNIKFASDGTMFVTSGDASSFNFVDDDSLRAQSLDSLAGKMLRIAPNGQGVPGNPFWNGTATANRSKVWSYGLRNAFRFGLRPGTSMPYLGDVGWSSWEEVNVGRAGANLGWPCYEGPYRQAGFEGFATCQALYGLEPGGAQAPLAAYFHGNAGASVTGGAFYSGTAFPAEYRDAYFFGDYAQMTLSYLHVDANDNLVGTVRQFATGVNGPVDIQTDGTNLLYLAINTGELRRIRHTNAPPPAGVSYVSDLGWTASNGSGPVERDLSNGEHSSADGGPLSLGGVTYAKGLGAHAPSDIRLALGATCSSVQAAVGVDDEVGNDGSVVFEVWADGTKLYDSGLMTGA